MVNHPYLEIPRGIRNKNPGNIRASEDYVWHHQTAKDANNFCIFAEPVWGIRAMAVLLSHYVEYDGIQTLRGLVERWAPASENDTRAYVKSVASDTGINPDDLLILRGHSLSIITAIIWHENGECPYSEDIIKRGIMLSHQW